ncbi:MAG: hypothetical protein EA374_02955 [Acholeplasmatales bacterium]|nr:MAG: hypothetical protein EA374_02955 [Acholeplasmatales bacterium]
MLMLILISGLIALMGRMRQSDRPFEIITVRQCHTYVYTHALETFSVPFLITDERSPYTVEEAVINPAVASSDMRMRMPLELVEIQSLGQVVYDGQPYKAFNYVLRPVFHADDFLLNIPDARLVFDLENGRSADLDIGAFNYVFARQEADWLQISARYNVHLKLHDIPTATGMVLSVENTRTHPVEISDMSINCDPIAMDMSAFVLYEGEGSAHLEHALFEPEIEQVFATPTPQDTAIVIMPGETLQFFIPFRYEGKGWLLDRYPVVFSLIGAGHVHRQVVDDFQFIRTQWFAAVHPTAHIRHHDSD